MISLKTVAYFFIVGAVLIAVSTILGYLADIRIGRPLDFNDLPFLQILMSLGIGGVLYWISER